jgi:hypothetical protein
VRTVGAGDPFFRVRRADRQQAHRRRQRFGLHVAAAHQLVQRDALGAQVVLGGQFLRGRNVEAGLGLARVGDGRGAHLEVALRRRQLFADAGAVGTCCRQGVLRGQHVEVGLRDLDDQVLLGRLQVGLRDLELTLGLVDRHAVGPIE